MKQSAKKIYKNEGKDKLLSRLSLFVFDRSRTAAVIWLCLTVFGVFSYTTFLKREGFPSINIPYSIISGTYFANDASKVDAQVAKPIGDIVLKNSHVKSVQSQAQGTFYVVTVQYKEGTNVGAVNKELDAEIKKAQLPQQATVKIETPKIGFTERGDDGVVSLYTTKKNVPQTEMVKQGEALATFLKDKHLASLESVSVVDPFVSGVDPLTGQPATRQTKFDRYGERKDSTNKFYDSVAVGFMQKDGSDVIKLNEAIEAAVSEYNSKHSADSFTAVVSATYAHDITDQIGELQKSLFEGLLAVLIIGSIVIAIRASLITVLAMLTVLAITLGVLFVAGYSLNTITLFSLILCMGLIVDDTIIMVEALDAQRRKRKDPRETVQVATRKVSRAMVAATSTAALSFAPLLFVGGILGSFIRAIPVTVITSLVVSLLVALIFIPLFARYLLLGKKQMGADHVNEPAAGIEAKIAEFICKPMLWARNKKKRLFGVGITAVMIGLAFVVAAMFLFQKVTFNIFPPSKDSNGLSVTMSFDQGDTIAQAEKTSDRATDIISDTLGSNFKTASYYANASDQKATMTVYITPYDERDVTAPQLVDTLNAKFKHFEGAHVKVGQLDVGPPASAFTVRIETADREKAMKLAKNMQAYLQDRKLTRPSGEKATITETSISDPGSISRNEGKQYVEVTANFDGTDTTTLVTLAQKAVDDEYTDTKLSSQFGLNKDVIKYDFGQEDENQDSFKALALAFPILLFVIYLLLAVQFRSLAQPLLIFMALPFSLFGITLGLYLTDNAFSFFAMLGFFALIGLSIKNTILLTDYANQLRRTGDSAIDAAVGALAERFRPLIATSLTAVVSLIPLALSSPFWEGLAVVLISGLLSSTFLVLTVFPYYYLGAEYLRLRISRKAVFLWIGLTVVLGIALSKASPIAGALSPIIALLICIMLGRRKRKKA